MIIGTGVDIVEVARINQSIEKYGDKFLQKTFTQSEIDYCSNTANSTERFAARFAAKEAAMKALGTGWQEGVGFLSIEVLKNDLGAPSLRFHGRAEEIIKEKNCSGSFVSYSHIKAYAVAQVVLEGSNVE
ncbi:MAG: holo-ACP synthase [Planctomycetota bacterium]|jgi:holo-[acyl-carrier protein] synthase